MSYELIWEPEALAQAERFAKDDPDCVRQVFTAAELPDAGMRAPRPPWSSRGRGARREE